MSRNHEDRAPKECDPSGKNPGNGHPVEYER